MKGHSGLSTSLWMKTRRPPLRPALTTDANADVCVVGAGIAGLTTAYLLAREKKSVVVLDDGPIAGGETERTTAHLSNAFDDRYTEMERLLGEEASRRIAQSHTAAIDMIETIVDREGIDCSFARLDGFLFPQPGSDPKELLDELEAARRAGLVEVELVERAPVPLFDTGPAIRFPRQGRFHPTAYLQGLIEKIEAMGGRIYAYTHAERIEGGAVARVKTSAGPTITCEAVVVATNSPVNDRFAIHTKQTAWRTYVVGLRVERGSVPDALVWDMADPYHYVRLQEEGDHDVLVVGGEDHRTGQAHDFAERYARLEAWARERWPCGPVEYRWSGQVMEPFDGVAFIGRNPMDDDNVFIATGDSGMGMTHGTIAGMLLTDLILGYENPWAQLYDPRRKTPAALGELAKENLNIVAQYADWVAPGDVPSTDEIPPGSGAVVRRGLQLVACYVDENGRRHECSAVCPHLGGIVSWNAAEKSWDCPVHGSRFEATGAVVNGPANRGLGREEPVEQEEEQRLEGDEDEARRPR